MEAASTTTAPIAPPEGEHFWFEDDGQRLVLHVRSVPDYSTMIAPAAFLVCGIAFAAACINSRAWQSPGMLVLLACLSAAIAAGAGVFILPQLLGVEVVTITRDEISTENRLAMRVRRARYQRKDCSKLRWRYRDRELGPFRVTMHSPRYGRLAFQCEGREVRFAAPLSDDEAVAACEFLRARCPDLGPRGDES